MSNTQELQEQLPIFVYGTLRPGAAAFGKVRPYVREIHDAHVTGFGMYSCGQFPALVKEQYNSYKVAGELLWGYSHTYEALLFETDRYEGEGWLFKRERVMAYDDRAGVFLPAHIYVGIEAGLIIDRKKPIPDLDWFKRGGADA